MLIDITSPARRQRFAFDATRAERRMMRLNYRLLRELRQSPEMAHRRIIAQMRSFIPHTSSIDPR